MKRVSSTLVIMLVLAALTALAGCGQKQAAGGTAKLLMMGNENMAFLEIVSGSPTGFSADLAAEIADRLGRQLVVTIEPFAELFPRLKSGECDIAMSAITITPERQAEVDVSDPYFSSGQALLVPKDSAIAGTSDLRGKTVGVLKDSTNQQEAEGIAGIRQILPFDAKEPMFDALAAGALDEPSSAPPPRAASWAPTRPTANVSGGARTPRLSRACSASGCAQASAVGAPRCSSAAHTRPR